MLLRTWTFTVLLLSLVQAHDNPKTPDPYYVSAGHLAVLPCCPSGHPTDVSWSKEGLGPELGAEDQGLFGAPGVEVQQGELLFKPAQPSHSGLYTCRYRSENGETQAQAMLSVSSEKCPSVADHRQLNLGENGRLPCQLEHIYKAYNRSSVRWMKGCAPLNSPRVLVDELLGQLWLTSVSPEDAGTYTCFIDVNVGGQNYSAAWSVNVTLNNDSVFMKPHVIYPKNEVVKVHLGRTVELRCLADLGHSKDDHTDMYWLVNDNHTEDYPELNDSWTIVSAGQGLRGVSTLVIPEVDQGFLNISIACFVRNAVGDDQGLLWLAEAEPDELPSVLAWSLGLSLALLLLAVLLYSCRVELVLAHRHLRSRFHKHNVHDGKLYDGLVTCLYPSDMTTPELSRFSLQVLPKRLEKEWGYRLYVPGRDDCPGEAKHDALSETLKKSRRLLLLLSPSGTQGAPSLSEEHQPLCYELRVGLYDALMNKELRVILIEIGGPVDYSRLPESVQYLKRTQGALRWRPSSRGRLRRLLHPERSFWNGLRYHMPPEPSGRGASSGSTAGHSLNMGPIKLVKWSPSLVQVKSSDQAVPV